MADYLNNDPDLWNVFRRGNEQAFAQIYRNYVKVLYRYGLKIIPDTVLIEGGVRPEGLQNTPNDCADAGRRGR